MLCSSKLQSFWLLLIVLYFSYYLVHLLLPFEGPSIFPFKREYGRVTLRQMQSWLQKWRTPASHNVRNLSRHEGFSSSTEPFTHSKQRKLKKYHIMEKIMQSKGAGRKVNITVWQIIAISLAIQVPTRFPNIWQMIMLSLIISISQSLMLIFFRFIWPTSYCRSTKYHSHYLKVNPED